MPPDLEKALHHSGGRSPLRLQGAEDALKSILIAA
jgi:hypothetical protein